MQPPMLDHTVIVRASAVQAVHARRARWKQLWRVQDAIGMSGAFGEMRRPAAHNTQACTTADGRATCVYISKRMPSPGLTSRAGCCAQVHASHVHVSGPGHSALARVGDPSPESAVLQDICENPLPELIIESFASPTLTVSAAHVAPG